MRQLVDWRAAVASGLVSGSVFLALAMFLSSEFIGSPWVVVRWFASILMGTGVLPPPAGFDVRIFFSAIAVHFSFSIVLACIIAFVLHRWGLVVGILGGAVLGLSFYFINFYSLSYFFPWFFSLKSWIMLAGHGVFGALAGGIYELFEVERFVPADQ